MSSGGRGHNSACRSHADTSFRSLLWLHRALLALAMARGGAGRTDHTAAVWSGFPWRQSAVLAPSWLPPRVSHTRGPRCKTRAGGSQLRLLEPDPLRTSLLDPAADVDAPGLCRSCSVPGLPQPCTPGLPQQPRDSGHSAEEQPEKAQDCSGAHIRGTERPAACSLPRWAPLAGDWEKDPARHPGCGTALRGRRAPRASADLGLVGLRTRFRTLENRARVPADRQVFPGVQGRELVCHPLSATGSAAVAKIRSCGGRPVGLRPGLSGLRRPPRLEPSRQPG